MEEYESNRITLYSQRGCPFCVRAVDWLNQYGVEYKLVDLSDRLEKRDFYNRTPGVQTLPQLYVDGKRIGGWTDLVVSDFAKQVKAGTFE